MYLDLTKAEGVSMFTQCKLKDDVHEIGGNLVFQAISWSILNDKRIYRKFIDQAKLYRTETVLESILRFNNFLNVFLNRYTSIDKSVNSCYLLLLKSFIP